MPPKRHPRLISFFLMLALSWLFAGCERPQSGDLSRTAYLLTDPILLSTQEHADNHLSTTYNLAKDLPGLGPFTITYPKSMKVGLPDFVILQLTPTAAYGASLLQINAGEASLLLDSSPVAELQTITIQPKMTALLSGENYSIQAAESLSAKVAVPEKTMTWVWIIVPKSTDTPELNLRLFNAIKSNQQVNDDLLTSIPLGINVMPNDTEAAPTTQISFSLILIVIAALGLFMLFLYTVILSRSNNQENSTNQPPAQPEINQSPTETTGMHHAPTTTQTERTPNTSPQYLSHLRLLLTENFNAEDLKNLTFDLGYQYDQIRGENLEGKARELILKLKHEGRLNELVALGQKARPHLDWEG